MPIIPEFEDFTSHYNAEKNQVIYTRLAADLDTPVSLMMKLTGTQKDSFVLESVTGGEVRGRYSIVGMKPDLVWKCEGDKSYLNRDARFDQDGYVLQSKAPLSALRDLLTESHIDLPDDLPQSSAGLFGYLGYDMIRLVEHLPNINPDPIGLPDSIFLRPTVIAVLDGVKGEVILVAPVWHNSSVSPKAAYAQAAERIMDAVRDLERPVPDPRRLGAPEKVAPLTSNFSKQDYIQAVEKAKSYIRAGDIFHHTKELCHFSGAVIMTH